MDQIIFIQQGGRNRHDHICESLELFASEVMPEFKERKAEREAQKQAELAPYIEAALLQKSKRNRVDRECLDRIQGAYAVAMTLPEMDPDPARRLSTYFGRRGPWGAHFARSGNFPNTPQQRI